MSILLMGGTGNVGSRVARVLRERGHEVAVLTHSPEKAERLPQGIEARIGDLEEPDSLPPALDGIETVFLATPISMSETEMGLNAVRAAQEAGVRRFVYMSVYHADDVPQIPHFQTKVPIQNAVRESGMEWTILQPNEFYQNDLSLREPILNLAIYPHPIGDVGISRVDTRDIADAAVNALTQEGHAGMVYTIVGPDGLTGEDCARAWSRHVGHDVQYTGNNIDAWAAQARLLMPSWIVQDLRVMFEYFSEEGLLATDEELALQSAVMGRAPRRFEDFVAETAARWRGEEPPAAL